MSKTVAVPMSDYELAIIIGVIRAYREKKVNPGYVTVLEGPPPSPTGQIGLDAYNEQLDIVVEKLEGFQIQLKKV